MTLFKCQRSVQGANGTTRDEYVNTFWLLGNGNLTDLVNGVELGMRLANDIDNYWVNPDGAGLTVLEYMSRRYQGPATYRFYENALPGPSGPPQYTCPGPFSFVPPDEPGLPEECAVALSYNVVPPGIIPARARGRIYIGPLNIHAMDEIVDNDQPVRIAPALTNRMLTAAVELQAALNAHGFSWMLASRMNADAYEITNWSVDDAFDTIRGRGSAPSVRISA